MLNMFLFFLILIPSLVISKEKCKVDIVWVQDVGDNFSDSFPKLNSAINKTISLINRYSQNDNQISFISYHMTPGHKTKFMCLKVHQPLDASKNFSIDPLEEQGIKNVTLMQPFDAALTALESDIKYRFRPDAQKILILSTRTATLLQEPDSGKRSLAKSKPVKIKPLKKQRVLQKSIKKKKIDEKKNTRKLEKKTKELKENKVENITISQNEEVNPINPKRNKTQEEYEQVFVDEEQSSNVDRYLEGSEGAEKHPHRESKQKPEDDQKEDTHIESEDNQAPEEITTVTGDYFPDSVLPVTCSSPPNNSFKKVVDRLTKLGIVPIIIYPTPSRSLDVKASAQVKTIRDVSNSYSKFIQALPADIRGRASFHRSSAKFSDMHIQISNSLLKATRHCPKINTTAGANLLIPPMRSLKQIYQIERPVTRNPINMPEVGIRDDTSMNDSEDTKKNQKHKVSLSNFNPKIRNLQERSTGVIPNSEIVSNLHVMDVSLADSIQPIQEIYPSNTRELFRNANRKPDGTIIYTETDQENNEPFDFSQDQPATLQNDSEMSKDIIEATRELKETEISIDPFKEFIETTLNNTAIENDPVSSTSPPKKETPPPTNEVTEADKVKNLKKIAYQKAKQDRVILKGHDTIDFQNLKEVNDIANKEIKIAVAQVKAQDATDQVVEEKAETQGYYSYVTVASAIVAVLFSVLIVITYFTSTRS